MEDRYWRRMLSKALLEFIDLAKALEFGFFRNPVEKQVREDEYPAA